MLLNGREMSLYSRLFARTVAPAHDLLRGRRQVQYGRFLAESQWWSQAEVAEFQWRELRRLVEHAFLTIPYYQRKYAAAGIRLEDIQSPADYARLPILTREEINDHREELRSTAYRKRLISHATGGSSGTPTRFYISIESYDWRTACTQRAYGWSGYQQGERTLHLWGAPIGRPPRLQAWKSSLYAAVRRDLFFNTFSQSAALWERVYSAALRFRPRFVIAYVSSLEQFARYLLERNLKLSGVRAAISAAEAVCAHHKDLCRQALGAPLFNVYGSREFRCIASECEQQQGLHINSENILVETALPPQEGPSEILITDLHNYGMPFLRYAIGDVGQLESAPCPCGRGLPRLRSVEGRVLDMLRTADGRLVPGEFFPHLLKEFPEIAEFQVEQTSLTRILISVVLRQPLAESSRALIFAETKRVFGEDAGMELRRVDSIPPRPSGKRRVTIGLPG
jgi:phenylacetate-CoA ligase